MSYSLTCYVLVQLNRVCTLLTNVADNDCYTHYFYTVNLPVCYELITSFIQSDNLIIVKTN